MSRKIEFVIYDWKEIDLDEEALKRLQQGLKKFGVYIGDAEDEVYGTAMADHRVFYISKKKIPKKQLEKLLTTHVYVYDEEIDQ